MSRPAPGRALDDARRWVRQGSVLVLAALERFDDSDLERPTALPGWSGKHVVAHLAANADALGNLVRWAHTGVPTPMYATPEQRSADIARGAGYAVEQLREWVAESAAALAAAMGELTPSQWQAQVVTAQGRTVPATEIPWLRAREVMVHAVDLEIVEFVDLPEDFLVSLVTDVVARRSAAGDGPALLVRADDDDVSWAIPGTGHLVQVTGLLGDLTAYLTGRPGGPVVTTAGDPAPPVPRWL